MARDYKPAARSRTAQPTGSGSSLLVGVVIGLLLGLGIALGVAIYLNKGPDPFTSRSKHPEPAPNAKQESGKVAAKTKAEDQTAKAAEKPRFDFYNILPGTDDAKDKSQGKQATDGSRPTSPEAKETFYVQAGAFQSAADADNLKARLAMLGVEAAVQSGLTMDRGQLHRVRVGPFTRVEDVNRIRDTLKQNGIETTLIKGREAPK